MEGVNGRWAHFFSHMLPADALERAALIREADESLQLRRRRQRRRRWPTSTAMQHSTDEDKQAAKQTTHDAQQHNITTYWHPGSGSEVRGASPGGFWLGPPSRGLSDGFRKPYPSVPHLLPFTVVLACWRREPDEANVAPPCSGRCDAPPSAHRRCCIDERP